MFYSNGSFTDKYAKLYHTCSDSVIKYLPKQHFYYQYATISLSSSNKGWAEKIEVFRKLLERSNIDDSWRAILNSIIADFYKELDDLDKVIYYKAAASIYDIKSAKRETTSKKDLALYMFERGDLDRASEYIRLALYDAEFYNARHRKAEISTVLKIIEQKKLANVEHDRNLLIGIVITITILLILLVITIILIYKQMKKLSQAQCIIEKQNAKIKENHQKLQESRELLLQQNRQLEESNNIKDEYIGNAFYLNAEYISKIEAIYKLVNRKLIAKQYEDLRLSFKESDLKKERENMYIYFDRTFLKLFPNFIEEYNHLFLPENRVYPKKELTPEMRIFALIRLGITDSNSIANFLNYSVNTVNTYKTKAKNKSVIANELFEDEIIKISSEVEV
ncbi:MAG: DUF6377 domain-containing protein [Bacteroides sp.]|nr:DUF6377 domain-containing protein [Bacteroides sp.]